MTLTPEIERPGRRDDTFFPDYSDYRQVAPHFERFAALDVSAPERPVLRERLILIHLPLAENIARRFARRGVPSDDLLQVARVGLLTSVDRFDPTRGTVFLAFAVPTIAGDLRRHFRDHGWYVRPPRRLQDIYLQLDAAVTELSHRDRRSPTATDLADHLGVGVEEIVEGLQLTSAYTPIPLDAPNTHRPDGSPLVESLGALDQALGKVDDRETLKRLIATLPERERRILGLRFFEDRTQRQIASEVGISQMHVSRVLSATLARLHERLPSNARGTGAIAPRRSSGDQ
ncbi:RNA polymerase sigma-B factor [Cryptosporangium aurantiacum]|uniref:RNA polymerase sigma-B factor n=2 Tax=Cryptosporangium aurantiacum TaxID=134849 RepID=A0A1M7Q7T6_9ACTN|nr:RNA polymerase sigma-B factor [Cryptosporangium aurantiacum]